MLIIELFSHSNVARPDPYIAAHGSAPWLATTFNLTYELAQFAAYFQVRHLFRFIFLVSICFSIVSVSRGPSIG